MHICLQDRIQLSHVIQCLATRRDRDHLMEPEYFQYLLLMLLTITKTRPENLQLVASLIGSSLLEKEGETKEKEEEEKSDKKERRGGNFGFPLSLPPFLPLSLPLSLSPSLLSFLLLYLSPSLPPSYTLNMQWVGTKQTEFQVNSMQLLYYQVKRENTVEFRVQSYTPYFIQH